MSEQPLPSSHPVTDAEVTWFGASPKSRDIGGVPQSRYGWLALADGGVAIVKAMDPDLVAYNKTLLDHERRMLERLTDMGAPTPQLLDLGREDWLVTRFAGLSLQRLAHPAGLQGTPPLLRLPLAERLSLWIHTLRRLAPLAQQGVLVVDLYDANVVAPLTQGLSGQLRLSQPVVIDHAFTLEAGMDLRRPVWLNREMERIPPELRAALQHDQQALESHFATVGAALPGYSMSRMPGQRDLHSRRMWAEYNAPQALQQLVDSGQLNCHHAMQFAAAQSMRALLALFPVMPGRAALERALATMGAVQASQRYPSLDDAANALEAVLGAVPLVSAHHYEPVGPQDLATPDTTDAGTAAAAQVLGGDGSALGSAVGARATGASSPSPAGSGHGSMPTPSRVTGSIRPRAVAWWRHPAWPMVLAGVGAALGAVMPLPW